jgi:ribonuclease HI|tara:strand:+ start:7610 stop:8014 length:405 start_codon:yes stop_codon:yes gene_type:complete
MIYTNSDGGSRGNPGQGAIGVLVRENESILTMHSEKIGNVTNNIAEYKGLIRALELASKHTKTELTCFLDSELVVKQLLGEYQVKNEKLLQLFLEVQKLQDNFKKIKYVHVKRNDNFQQIADVLLNIEFDKNGK